MEPRQQQMNAPEPLPVKRYSRLALSRRGLLSQMARLGLAGMLMLMAFLMPSVARGDGTEAWQVSGTMEESTDKTGTNAYGTATGDLAGAYKVKFISEVNNGDGTVTVLTRRTIDTEDGTLVLDEVGTVDLATLGISVVSTVGGGNGIFKNATGTLYLNGQENADGTVTFTYSGTINLVD